jgi:uncharacterized protein (DUF1330 family)
VPHNWFMPGTANMLRSSRIAVAVLVFASFAGSLHPAIARGGHGGFHGGRIGGVGLPAAAKPAYVVVDVTETTDAQAYKTMVANAETAVIQFGGRILIDSDGATALDGAVPQRLLIIAFDNAENAQAWKASPSFEEFNAARGTAVKSRAFMVEGMPTVVAGAGLGRGRHMRYDPKPFEEIIKRRDDDLHRIKDICKGC